MKRTIETIFGVLAAILLAAFGLVYFAIYGVKSMLIWLWNNSDVVFIILCAFLAVLTVILLNTEYLQAAVWCGIGSGAIIIYLLLKWEQEIERGEE